MVENDENFSNYNTCLELALEGERLCKCGDFGRGVAYFEASLKEGTDDNRTLSAIYSQLGNALFYLGDYQKALHYHQLDLKIAKTSGDRSGEGKASGNLGNTYKMLGRFDEAIDCCSLHLAISRELKDQVGEGRALYNLGNVWHTKGKQMAKLGLRDPGDLPEDVKQTLQKAIHFYEQNLSLMTQLGDKNTQGRAYGNLGNTHYLLGNFGTALNYHLKRLDIAREFNDKSAERRAHCNLGNAHIFLGDFAKAIVHYEETLRLAQELKDRVVEGQACYSLGNSYTLLKDYQQALDYHTRHLRIAQELKDRVGESRAYWSLSNVLASTGKNREALNFSTKHLQLAKELGDSSGISTAQSTIADLQARLGDGAAAASGGDGSKKQTPTKSSLSKKRLSMDNMELLKLTPVSALTEENAASNLHLNLLSEKVNPIDTTTAFSSPEGPDDLFNLIEAMNSRRMDEQRASISIEANKENRRPPPKTQRNPLSRSTSHPAYPHSHRHPSVPNATAAGPIQTDQCNDELFDLIASLQGNRLDEQRAELPASDCDAQTTSTYISTHKAMSTATTTACSAGPTGAVRHQTRQMSLGAESLLDEKDDFLDNLMMRLHTGRIDDQRCLPPEPNGNGKMRKGSAGCGDSK